jgi:thioredoxin 1
MKKITVSAFILFILVFSSCNSVGGNGTETTSTDVKEGVVVQMNTEMFKKLVYNYQKNPKDWVFEGDKPVIIDFYADWCRPCKMVAPIMDELAKEYKGKVTFYKINTDQEKELSQLFNIRSIPALLYIPKSGQPQMTVGLSSKETYVQQIESLLLGGGAKK